MLVSKPAAVGIGGVVDGASWMPLTDVACRGAKPGPKLRKLSDMAGLQLWVQPTGSRLWRFAYRFNGKQKLLALGVYPAVSLAQARAARDEARQQVATGRDPSELRRIAKLTKVSSDNSFRAIASEYIAKLGREGRAATTVSKVEWLLDFALPALGSRPVREIQPIEVLAVLRKIESRGRYESARRLKSTIGTVIRYAIATARAEQDPTASLQGALTTPTVTPRAAVIEPRAVGALMRAIDGFEGQPTVRAALKLMALLFPRPGELRMAEWHEFDFAGQVWTIPAAKTKMRKPHAVPLCRQALAVLDDLKAVSGSAALVFPGVRSLQRPISEVTMNAALRRLGYSKNQATAHGFRATASTLLNESGHWSADAIECQLAHTGSNDVRRAYARGDHWQERVRMMAWWADYLDDLKTNGKVLPLNKVVA